MCHANVARRHSPRPSLQAVKPTPVPRHDPPTDSAIWAAANCGGMTVFLENMQEWIDQVTKKIPGITVYQVGSWEGAGAHHDCASVNGTHAHTRTHTHTHTHTHTCARTHTPTHTHTHTHTHARARAHTHTNTRTHAHTHTHTNTHTQTHTYTGIRTAQATYSTNLDKPAEFLKSPSDPDMPAIVKNSCFDVVLVDSPMGWKAGHPGRFQPVYWSVNMARRCIKEGKKQQVGLPGGWYAGLRAHPFCGFGVSGRPRAGVQSASSGPLRRHVHARMLICECRRRAAGYHLCARRAAPDRGPAGPDLSDDRRHPPGGLRTHVKLAGRSMDPLLKTVN